MNEYEVNKNKIAAYRKRSDKNWFLLKLCKIMEWVNERCIRED